MPKTLDQAQAIQAATVFCKAIGAPVTAPTTAVHDHGETDFPLPPTYWQPRWFIHFGSDTEVEVADSGVICGYQHSESGPGTQDRQPPGPAISRAAALARSAAVLSAAHVTEALAPPQAQEQNGTVPATRVAHEWFITRERQAQGIPCQWQQATVNLQAETGAVLGLGVTFPTPPPKFVKPVVTQRQAVLAGQAYLQEIRRADLVPVGSLHLVWVTPQTQTVYPRVNGVALHPPAPIPARYLPPRLAWMCSFGSKRGDGAVLPVDVLTGEVVSNGASFGYGPITFPRPAANPVEPSAPPTPTPPVLGPTVTMTTLPGATYAAIPAGVPRYRLSLTDVYASIATLNALGYSSQISGNEITDQALAQKIRQAAQVGSVVLVPGPSAVVPEGGVWGLIRTRDVICKDPLYWKPRPVPATITMTFSVTPQRQADGKIMYRYDFGNKALPAGKAWTPEMYLDTSTSSWSWGDPGATTLLSGMEEEHYTWEVGQPLNFHEEGIEHILLIQGEPVPEKP